MDEPTREAMPTRRERHGRADDGHSPAGAHGVPAPPPEEALLGLERFLGAGRDDASAAPATALLGRRAARRYARALSSRRGHLLGALEAATRLPPSHPGDGDALPDTGTEDAARTVATWLELPHGYTEGATREALLARRERLVAATGRPTGEIAAGLSGEVCRRVLAALPDVAATKGDASERARAASATLGTLLDLADTLTLAAPDRLLRTAEDYVANGRERRARRLLSTHLERAPDDVPAGLALARIERARGHRERARRVLERLARHYPDDPSVTRALARSRTNDRRLEDAEAPASMPRVALDAEERATGRFHDDTLDTAVELYARHGTLLLEGAFDPALLEACRAQFVADYRDYLDDRRHPDALRIGDRRFQVSIAIAGAFNDPGFYANPFVLALMHRLLDRQAIIGSTVCATSLPGSSDQHLHKDHRALFTADADDPPIALPAVAVTTMIPLVALDERIGTTLVRKGSHRVARRASERLPEQTPVVPLGACFLMDLALSHRGQGNRTGHVRPIVNMQYTRRWFVDNKNFHKQRPLEIPPEEYARIPDEHRGLFDWARQPGPRVDR